MSILKTNLKKITAEANNELIKIYRDYWSLIKNIRQRNEGLSNPLLVKIPESYFEQKIKILIVGQQTDSWHTDIPFDDTNIISKLMDKYTEFEMGQGYHNSPFWRAFREIETELKIEKGSVIWSNLNLMDYYSKSPPKELASEMSCKIPILKLLIDTTKPDAIILFTCHNNDFLITNLFKNINLEAVKGFDSNALAKVIINNSKTKIYRTYHPNYLIRKKLYKKVIKKILTEIE